MAASPIVDATLDAGGVTSVVVFRALVLGDLLCATPALRALRRGFPRARIALVGLPAMRALVERLDSVDEFIDFPGHPGLPEVDCDVRALPAFFAGLQERRFDLGVQLHGSGDIVNPLVATFGAATTAGFVAPGVWRPQADAERYLEWPRTGHEIFRLLALTDHLGLPRDGTRLDLPLVAADFDALHRVWPGSGAGDREAGGPHGVDDRRGRGTGHRPYVCIHAGAQLPSRRWPPQRFAAVADALAERGYTVVLTGAAHEAALVGEVEAAMRRPCVNLVGRTSLWTLSALIDGADWLVCNDTGVSHVAAARGCRSVVVSSGADVARWAPLDGERHTVLWQDLACRPCSHRVCPFGHECAVAIEPADVLSRIG